MRVPTTERETDELASLHDELLGRLDELGITRLADTTGLDRVGIPTAAAVRPGTSDAIWVYSGKGETRTEARVVAVMECVERTSALWDGSRVRWATLSALREAGVVAWAPERFTEQPRPDLGTDPLIGWVEARRIGTDEPVLVPADLVFAGRRPGDCPAPSPFLVATSNGLGAGRSAEQAGAHALAELMERDVVSRYELDAAHGPATLLRSMARLLGADRESADALAVRDDVTAAPTIDPASLPSDLARLCERFERAGLRTVIKALPNDFGVSAFAVAAVEQLGFDQYLGCAGFGLNSDARRALRSALLELAQTRATDLQGAREDRGDAGKHRFEQAPTDHWLATPGAELHAWDAFVPSPAETAGHSVLGYAAALARSGLTDCALVSLGGHQGLHVVRAVVPGAETWHSTAGCSRPGPRARRRWGS